MDKELPAYLSIMESLFDQVDLVRVQLDHYITVLRARGGLQGRGLAVNDAEVIYLLGKGEEDGTAEAEVQESLNKVLAMEDKVRGRLATSREAGLYLPLVELAEELDLSADDMAIVRCLLAPEIEPGLERAFAFAWDDFTKKRPTVGFLMDFLGDDRERKDHLREHFYADAPLRRHHIIEVGNEELVGAPFVSLPVRLCTRVLDHLRGKHQLDSAISVICQFKDPHADMSHMVLPDSFQEKLRSVVVRSVGRGAGPLRLHVYGPPGTGKKSLAEALAAEMGHKVLFADWASLWQDNRPLPDDKLGRIVREAALGRALLFLDGGDVVPDDNVPWADCMQINRILSSCRSPLIVGGNRRLPWLAKRLQGMVELPMAFPDYDARALLWERALPATSRRSKRLDVKDLGYRYALSGGSIEQAADKALILARRRSARNPTITPEDVNLACQDHVNTMLSALAVRIETSLSWDDVILPEEVFDRLRELQAYARHRRAILDDWGFRRLVPYGQGLSVLFSGPPGTGKTMVAGILARALGMELFRVDLSRIVNKYIGETEKNLGKVFDEARESHAVLLFDEADSLFSKRTDVRSSVDRYANLEVNYLLQRMEDYDGVTILTTNFEAAIDEAFKRRLKYRVPFPFPGIDERTVMWRKMIPPQAKVDEEMDWKSLSAQFEMSGGHIKNAVMRGAVLAAEQGCGLNMDLLTTAAMMEYREMGKLVQE